MIPEDVDAERNHFIASTLEQMNTVTENFRTENHNKSITLLKALLNKETYKTLTGFEFNELKITIRNYLDKPEHAEFQFDLYVFLQKTFRDCLRSTSSR